MSKHFSFCIITLLSLGLIPLNAAPPVSNSVVLEELNLTIEEIDAWVNESLRLFDVPGASLSIVLDDQILLAKGYGYRDLENGLLVTEHTLFPVASCTKAFTALLAVQLAEEGIIRLDDPVQRYIPEFRLLDQDRTARLTLRDLLAHRSGIPRHDAIWYLYDLPRSSVLNILKDLQPVYGPLQNFQYNNFMYSVAGMAIERAIGQSWEEAVDARILKRLKLEGTFTSVKDLKNSSDHSLPYADLNGTITKIPFHDPYPVNPGVGLISNAADMANWLKFHLDQNSHAEDRIVQEDTLKETYRIQAQLEPPSDVSKSTYHQGYGLGWFIGKYGEFELIRHGGEIDGFSSEVAFLPEKRVGLVVLTNCGSSGRLAVESIRNRIFDKILEIEENGWINKLQADFNKSRGDLRRSLVLFADSISKPSSESLETYPGCYTHPAYGVVKVAVESDHLIACFGKTITPLCLSSEDTFSGKMPELEYFGISPIIEFKFIRDSSGSVYKVEIPFEGFRSADPISFIRDGGDAQ